MAACDVLVNLRSPTMGETSGSVIRGLALGKPMLVSDVGWFAELPDGVALKIPVDDYEVPTIAGSARARRRPRRRARSRRAPRTSTRHTTSGAPPTPTPPRSRRPPAARPSPTPCCMRIAEGAAEIGFDDPAELARLAREAGLV